MNSSVACALFKRPLNYPVAFPSRRLGRLGGDFCDVIFAGYLNRISVLVFQGAFFNCAATRRTEGNAETF